MNEELNALRDQIDTVDQQLVALLARRLALVAEVGEVKSRHGLPIYAPDREAAMLAKRRAEATANGVPADLIEDVEMKSGRTEKLRLRWFLISRRLLRHSRRLRSDLMRLTMIFT